MNKFWNITPSIAKEDVLNMYVYGDIVTDSSRLSGSPDDVVTREFIKDLNAHPNTKRINVYINSGGGEVFAAVEMAQQLKRHSAEVHTYVEGICASAATIIAMAGDVRHMTVSGLFMIHLPSMRVGGDKRSLAKGIEVLEKVEDVIRLTYKQKTTLSDEELSSMLDHETWLTAPEAYKYGFITDIEEDADVIDNLIKEVQNDIVAINGVDIKIAAYADPEQLRNKLTEIQNKKSIGGTDMDLQSFLNSLPVEKRSAVEDAINKLVNDKTTELSTQVTNLTEQLTSVTDQLVLSQETLTTTQNSLTECQDKLIATENKVTELSNKANQEDADTVFLNSLPAEAKQAVLDARKIAAEAQEALRVAEEAKNFAAFTEKVKAYDNLPLQDEHIKALYNMCKNCPEDFKAVEALFNVANNTMSQNFSQLGADGDGTGAPSNAFEQIEKLVNEKREANPTMDYNEAFAAVINENPSLYNSYRAGE